MGTNREVSGGFWEELLDETCLLQTAEPAWCCLCKKSDPEDTWQLPGLVVRVLMWRWSRENKWIHRFTDIAASSLYRRCLLRTTRVLLWLHAARQVYMCELHSTDFTRGRSTIRSSCSHNVEQDPSIYSCPQMCLCGYWALKYVFI